MGNFITEMLRPVSVSQNLDLSKINDRIGNYYRVKFDSGRHARSADEGPRLSAEEKAGLIHRVYNAIDGECDDVFLRCVEERIFDASAAGESHNEFRFRFREKASWCRVQRSACLRRLLE